MERRIKRKWKKLFTVLLVFIICVTTIDISVFAEEDRELAVNTENISSVSFNDIENEGSIQNDWNGIITQSVYEGKNFKVSFILNGQWTGGYDAAVKIENTGNTTIHNWHLKYDKIYEIETIWNAQVHSAENGTSTIKNVGWNQDIAAGQSIEYGFTGKGSFTGFPKEYSMPGTNAVTDQEDYEICYSVTSDWNSGFTGNITINNQSNQAIEDWKLTFDFENEISSIWNAEIVSHEENNYVIVNAGHNQNIAPNGSVSFGFVVNSGNSANLISGYKLEKNTLNNQTLERELEELEDIGEAYFKELTEDTVLTNEDTGIAYVKNQILISALLGADKSIFEEISDDIGADIVGYIELTNDYQIEFREDKTAEELEHLIAYLDSFSFVSSVSLNTVMKVEYDAITSDKEYANDTWSESVPDGKNWGLEALRIPSAWDYKSDFQSVRVGIIDNMFAKHEDLVFDHIFNNSADITSAHGTHVAGIMAATQNNNGIAGVITDARLYAYGTHNPTKDLIDAMKYKFMFANLIGNHVKVINVSLGAQEHIIFAASRGNQNAINYIETNADILEEFLNKLILQGYDFLIVTSAGNTEDNSFVVDNSNTYGYVKYNDRIHSGVTQYSGNVSAYYDCFLTAMDLSSVKSRIIVVGAVGHTVSSGKTTYSYTEFSNVGSRVDVCAPGDDIWSCFPTNMNSHGYGNNSGTSMASPYIAGIAGMIFQANPNLLAMQVKRIICSNLSTLVTDVHGNTYGMPDALLCIKAALGTQGNNSDAILPSGILTGKVIQKDGTPIKNVKLTVYKTSTGESNLENSYKIVATDQNGNYEMVLTQGTYNLNIYAEGYLPCMIKDVVIKADETTYLQNIILTKWSSNYLNVKTNGKVVNALDGKIISGASISARKGWNSKSGSYVTNVLGKKVSATAGTDGKFNMFLPIGIYTLEISKDGFVTGYCNIVSTIGTGEQTMVLTPILSDNEYRIILTWGSTPRDLDSHLTYYKDGENLMHVYYANKTGKIDGEVIAKLDLDDTSSYGPETVTITLDTETLDGGTFRYSVHDFTNRSSSNSKQLSMSGAIVRVYKGNDFVKTYDVPQNVEGTVWHVFDITEDGVISFNEFSYQSAPASVQ